MPTDDVGLAFLGRFSSAGCPFVSNGDGLGVVDGAGTVDGAGVVCVVDGVDGIGDTVDVGGEAGAASLRRAEHDPRCWDAANL